MWHNPKSRNGSSCYNLITSNPYYDNGGTNCSANKISNPKIINQIGGQMTTKSPDIVMGIKESLKETFHDPLVQINNVKANTKEIVRNTGKIIKPAGPIINMLTMVPCNIAEFSSNTICRPGLKIPCSMAKMYAKAVCLPGKMIENKMKKIFGASQFGGNYYSNPKFDYIYEPTTGKWVSLYSNRGINTILSYLDNVMVSYF